MKATQVLKIGGAGLGSGHGAVDAIEEYGATPCASPVDSDSEHAKLLDKRVRPPIPACEGKGGREKGPVRLIR